MLRYRTFHHVVELNMQVASNTQKVPMNGVYIEEKYIVRGPVTLWRFTIIVPPPLFVGLSDPGH